MTAIPQSMWGSSAPPVQPRVINQQEVQCIECAREGILQAPAQIIYLNGTSYCRDHIGEK